MINFQSMLPSNGMFHFQWNILINEEDPIGNLARRNCKCNLLRFQQRIKQRGLKWSLLSPTHCMLPSSSTPSSSMPSSSPSPSSSPTSRQKIHLETAVRLQSWNLLPIMPRSRLLEWSQDWKPQALQLRHQCVQSHSQGQSRSQHAQDCRCRVLRQLRTHH